MAKKKDEIKSCAVITPGYIQSASKRCVLPHCMGNPKDLLNATTFDGKICKECWSVHEYKPQELSDNQQKLEVQEEKVKTKASSKAEKIKNKTLTTSEDEIQKMIDEADKKDKKKVKTSNGEQQSMF